MKMVVIIGTLGTAHIKKALKEEIFSISPEEAGFPEPEIWKKDKDNIYYRTASGLGTYEFDFETNGCVSISFEGRRNSLLSGTPFFNLDIPSGIEAKKLKGRFVTLTTKCCSKRCGVFIDGEIVYVETSAPEQVLRINED